FLTEALRFFRGAAGVMMVDNTHVVVLRGTGAQMIPVPEMEAFGQRFGFAFRAHEKGDANRSARVERLFWHVETNFLAGRTFTDWKDLNQQARSWCEKGNSTYKRALKAKPVELYAVERTHLQPLPVWIPEPYRVHHRIVDVEGYVALDTNRYSVPGDWIGRQVQVRETQDRLEIQTQRAPEVI
ncbi:MAG: transposase, partial [Actinomycetia bacterium]|nr:transposase [Actinomycetes bacterium]